MFLIWIFSMLHSDRLLYYSIVPASFIIIDEPEWTRYSPNQKTPSSPYTVWRGGEGWLLSIIFHNTFMEQSRAQATPVPSPQLEQIRNRPAAPERKMLLEYMGLTTPSTVHSESIQTPWLFPNCITLQMYYKMEFIFFPLIYTQYPIMTHFFFFCCKFIKKNWNITFT